MVPSTRMKNLFLSDTLRGPSPSWLWSVLLGGIWVIHQCESDLFIGGLWVLHQHDCDLFSWVDCGSFPNMTMIYFLGGLCVLLQHDHDLFSWVDYGSFPSMTMRWPWACFLVWTVGSSPMWQWVSVYGWTVVFQARLCKVCLCVSALCECILTQHDCFDKLTVLGMNVLVD